MIARTAPKISSHVFQVSPTMKHVMPIVSRNGWIDGPGEVDLLADRRDLGIQRAHET